MSLTEEILARARKRLAEAQEDLAALRKNPSLSKNITVKDLEREVA